jgi:hypothetical protein
MAQGHIRPQGDGSWEIKFDLGRDPLSGRRITKYVTFRGTKRKAQEELTRFLGQRNEGSYVEPTKMTVAQYLLRCPQKTRIASEFRAQEDAVRKCRMFARERNLE